MNRRSRVLELFGIVLGVALMAVFCWGLWRLSALFLERVDDGDFVSQRVAIALLVLPGALLATFFNAFIYPQRKEKARLLIYLEIIELVIHEYQQTGDFVATFIDKNDLEPLVKYLDSHDYLNFMTLMSNFSVTDNSESQRRNLPEDAEKQLQVFQDKLRS